MRLSQIASAILALGLILPEGVSLSGPPEDLEGSGYDLEGSGDDPEQEEGNNNPDPAIVSNPANGNKNAAKSSSTLNVGSSYRHGGGTAPELVVASNGKSLLENREVVAAATAGGVTGAIIGALLSAILIYKWWKKHKEQQGQSKVSDEGYHKPIKDAVFI